MEDLRFECSICVPQPLVARPQGIQVRSTCKTRAVLKDYNYFMTVELDEMVGEVENTMLDFANNETPELNDQITAGQLALRDRADEFIGHPMSKRAARLLSDALDGDPDFYSA